jgi:ketosteroid isomerase-like protein
MTDDVMLWVEKQAIQEVVTWYSDAASRGAWDELAALWTEDGVWEVGPPVGTRIVGARAIREDLQKVNAADFLIQTTHGTVVTLHDATHASSRTTIHALARRTGHYQIVNYGIYYDELVKQAGRWRFARRMLQPIYSDTSPLPGSVPITRADLARLG